MPLHNLKILVQFHYLILNSVSDLYLIDKYFNSNQILFLAMPILIKIKELLYKDLL